jgi:hypothetical protein
MAALLLEHQPPDVLVLIIELLVPFEAHVCASRVRVCALLTLYFFNGA